jgi:phospholipid/cholesterol/gamma-HCH transport system substrate-binding protein
VTERPPSTPLAESEPGAAPPVRHLELKAALLLLFTAFLVAGSVAYLLYARGFFEPTQRLVLTTDDAEGVAVGMDMTFSGFPIGRVRRVELADNGNVRILIDVARKDAHWLRTSSVFTLVRGLVGGTAIRAFTGILADPALPDGAIRPVLRGDATAELPRVLESAREVLENIGAITAQDGSLRAALANVQEATQKLKGPGGALGVLFGNPADAKKLLVALDRSNALLARLDTVVGKADAQVLGPRGVVGDAQGAIRELQQLLVDTRASIGKLDAVLVEAQGIGANVRGATVDLGSLRGEVDANLRKIEGMLNELDRKWPLTRNTEVKLP